MNDRVKRQEEARGWHREVTPEASAASLLETLKWWYEPAVAANRNPITKAHKRITEDDMVPPGTMYALNFNSMKIAPDPEWGEWKHDVRIRKQYE